MIVDALRWIKRLDRSYFFAFASFIATVVVSITLLFAPIALDENDVANTLLQRDGAIVLIFLVLPVLVVASPLFSLPKTTVPLDRTHKINSVASTAILIVFIFISLPSFGLFYGPALVFSSASVVSLFFGRNTLPESHRVGSGRGGARMSGKAPGEGSRRTGPSGGERDAESAGQGSSPLASSRRRRRRRRRNR